MPKHSHYILHKPYGYLSQLVNNQDKRKNKRLLGALYDFAEGTMAIGRLDENSEGLLLLTTDGQVSEQIRSKKVEKEYYVQLDGTITPEAIAQLQVGVAISIKGTAYTTLPCAAVLLTEAPAVSPPSPHIRAGRHRSTSWIAITITEGKYRQIRKMTAKVGYPTMRLIRLRIGTIMLGKIDVGDVKQVASF